MNADTGAIIATKNAYQPYAIASITKLMTLYLLFKDIDSGHLQMNQHFVPCHTALQTRGSSMFMHPGLPFTVAQMILGMTVPSGNDAARLVGRQSLAHAHQSKGFSHGDPRGTRGGRSKISHLNEGV